MIKLLNVLKESYLDNQGNMISKPDFVVFEGGFNGGIYKDIEKVDINNFIAFTTKLSNFRKKDIANKIFKQILVIYNQSALKKYNENINFTPNLEYSRGDGNYEENGYQINLSNNLQIHGILNSYYYLPETGFDTYVKAMRSFFNDDKDKNNDDDDVLRKDKNASRFKDFDKENLKDKIKYLPIICIPKYSFSGNIIDQIDADVNTGNRNFSDDVKFYTKSNLLKDLNEIGLFLLSSATKEQVVDINKTQFDLYKVSFISIFTGYRNDGSSYEMYLGTEYNKKEDKLDTYYILVPKNKDLQSFLKSLPNSDDCFSLYSELYGWLKNNGKDNVKNIKKSIKKLGNTKVDLKLFNYLKKKGYMVSKEDAGSYEKIIDKDGILFANRLENYGY